MMNSPYKILYEKLDECPVRGKVYHFYQLVYIISGNGRQLVNDYQVPYKSGDMLVLMPLDVITFDIQQTTEFLFIRFSKHSLEQDALAMDNSLKLELLLSKVQSNRGCILRGGNDQTAVKYLTEGIVRESVNGSLYSKRLIEQYVNALILIVARNLAQAPLPEEISENSDSKIVNILQYIQNHICEPEKLKQEQIGAVFGLSTTYVSRYFKKHTAQTLQDYIAQYRLNLIENKLLYTNMRIGEIAFELGFTDESHLNHLFRKYRNLTPSEFRKKKSAAMGQKLSL
ncbi:MAG: AraC family transcriptional regulator [Chryseobacterium sp.]|uniref:AraC family transcriptional regulator n=1 Tax=Chryseobacterium sp. TaxID=1871047 RepID=UPI0025BDB539|nr:AraC family transcriptional regulator [Chryseobacterium sp.]MCJ7933365.1 AraC family transcriptional regulator [Chryseobacterium sp.]